MAKIKAKQTFTLRQGEIRVQWRSTESIDDRDIIDFITKDAIYSKNDRWREVFDILSFDEESSIKNHGKCLFGYIERGESRAAASSDEVSKDNGRKDFRSPNHDFDRQRKVNEFPVSNDVERRNTLNYFQTSQDVGALEEIAEELRTRGETRWQDDVLAVLRSMEIKKTEAAGKAAKDQMSSMERQ